MINAMRPAIAALTLLCATAPSWAQPVGAPSFDVISVKPSQRTLGKDANSRISFSAAGLSGRNVTLKHLITQAYHLQPHQVLGGPAWLDSNEYDLDAKAAGPSSREQLQLMLRTLLGSRFGLSVHKDTKELRVYELVVDKTGPKIHAVKDGEVPATPAGRRFHGDLEQFANLLSIQLTIPAMDDPSKPGIASAAPVPVLDKTALPGIFDFSVDMKPELGVDMFTLWQRVLQEQLGLKLENRKANVDVLVVDHAEKVPPAN
jgi:uncharacterized protein (TIGR03435 family)